MYFDNSDVFKATILTFDLSKQAKLSPGACGGVRVLFPDVTWLTGFFAICGFVEQKNRLSFV